MDEFENDRSQAGGLEMVGGEGKNKQKAWFKGLKSVCVCVLLFILMSS